MVPPPPGRRVRTVRRVGDRAVVADLEGPGAAAALARACSDHPLPGQVEVTGGATTVLVVLDRPVDLDAAGRHLRSLATDDRAVEPGTEHVLDVVYDGQDLADVADLTSMSVEGVVAAHTGRPWAMSFAGFAPGFAYLSGGDPRLQVPRRTSARTEVPAGSVALAGGFSSVYPRASPGGWQLVGRTGAVMWDLGRTSPALVQVGDTVAFRAVRELVEVPRPAAAPPGAPGADAEGPALLVLGPGACATVQDAGRPGHAGLGVPSSGPMDAGALRSANRAVGNTPGAAALEVVGGGVRLQARGDVVVAVTGAPLPLTRTGAGSPAATAGRARAPGLPFALRDGEVLDLGGPRRQRWSYLAVRGGLVVPPVLDSRSTDTLSGLGPPRLAPGALLPVGRPTGAAVEPAPAAAGPDHPVEEDGVVLVDVVLGPREDWFTPAALEQLLGEEWVVTPSSDRVGLRLRGPTPLERAVTDELPSEGVVAGALQVPADGQPVLFAADHPVTGGYPVIAVVASGHLDRALNTAPGTRLRFRRTAP